MSTAKDRERLLAESQANDKLGAAASTVLQQNIAWESYQGASLISKTDLSLLRRFDKQSKDVQYDLLTNEGAAYAEMFMSVLKNITQDNVPQYIVAQIDAFLTDRPLFAKIFANLWDNASLNPFTVLVRLIKRASKDDLLVAKACNVAAVLLHDSSVAARRPPPDQDVADFLSWMCVQLGNRTLEKTAVPCFGVLQVLLRHEQNRHAFVRSNGVPLMEPYLEIRPGAQPNLQMLYQVANCYWILSYTKGLENDLVSLSFIQKLITLLKTVTKEKVIRMALATLRNLIETKACKQYLMELGAPKVLSHVRDQGWGDEDIVDDLKVLDNKLEQNLQFLTTFDEYRKEVLTSELEWSPVHRSQKFWNDNATKFEERNFEVVRMLVKIINPTTPSVTPKQMAVAAHDIGEFMQHYPRGKSIVSEMGAKAHIMMLLTSDNEEVKKEALLCVQKMMIH